MNNKECYTFTKSVAVEQFPTQCDTVLLIYLEVHMRACQIGAKARSSTRKGVTVDAMWQASYWSKMPQND